MESVRWPKAPELFPTYRTACLKITILAYQQLLVAVISVAAHAKNGRQIRLTLRDRAGTLRRANERLEKRIDRLGLRTARGNRACLQRQPSHPDLRRPR